MKDLLPVLSMSQYFNITFTSRSRMSCHHTKENLKKKLKIKV